VTPSPSKPTRGHGWALRSLLVDWQLLVVAPILVAAIAYLGRQTWRTWRGRKAGCGGCGSCGAETPAPAALIPPEQLMLRSRRRV